MVLLVTETAIEMLMYLVINTTFSSNSLDPIVLHGHLYMTCSVLRPSIGSQ